MIDYQDIPDWWALCPNASCKMAEKCLRQQACRQMSQEVKRWNCVLPHAQSDNDCEFYLKYEKETMAKGLTIIYKDVHSREMRAKIRKDIISYLGSKGTYYRYQKGERLMNPNMQQDIIDIVHSFVPEAEVIFDKTFEGYDFTKY